MACYGHPHSGYESIKEGTTGPVKERLVIETMTSLYIAVYSSLVLEES